MKNYTRRSNLPKLRFANKTNKILLLIVSLAIAALLIIPHRAISKAAIKITATSTMAEPMVQMKTVEPVKLQPKKPITEAQVKSWREKDEVVEQKLTEYFSSSTADIALAILKHESGLNVRATNWNCWYDANGVAYENKGAGMKGKSCKPEDRQISFGVDCGISQVHFRGKRECPAYSYELDWGIKKMADMYNARGFSPWVSYTNGAYKDFLK